jgi:NAD(P)H-flavin reductase
MMNSPPAFVPHDAIVEEVEDEAADTKTLTVRLCNGATKVRVEPGQFNLVGLPGVGEAPITFSSIGEDGRFTHTIRAAGWVTRALLRLEPGQTVQVRGPFGTPWPWDELRNSDLIVCAGGIGMVPIRPLLHKLFSHRDWAGQLLILYGSRAPKDMLFHDEVVRWRSIPDTEVRLIVDTVPEGTAWSESVGVVTDLLAHPSEGPPADTALICGPELMMRFTVRELMLRGMRPGRIFVMMERYMKCGIGQCGHCQLGPKYVCQDGPVFRYSEIRHLPDTML